MSHYDGLSRASCEEGAEGYHVRARDCAKMSVHSGAGTNSTVTTRLLAARIGAAIDRARGYVLRPIANRLCTERTYMTPCDSAGVAINNSPMEFVAICLKVGPAWTTEISPSSLDR